MKISVAMTTYKSSRFVREQLESIFRQTYLPDEIIICDDASPDDTVEVLEEIIRLAPKSIQIKVYKNLRNVGHVKNFENCFTKCSGDIICLCDADDIWERNKIEVVASEFELNPEIVLAFHDAVIINSTGTVIKESLNEGWDFRKDKSNERELLLMIAKRQGVPYGFSIAFRKEILRDLIPFPKGYGHDEWLGLCAPLYGKVATIPEKLAKYRRHENNTSNNRPSISQRMKNWDRESWFTHAQDIKCVYETYLNRYSEHVPEQLKNEIEGQIEFQTHLEKIINKECWGGIKLLKFFMNGTYQKYRGTRNTLILDELYLILHMFK